MITSNVARVRLKERKKKQSQSSKWDNVCKVHRHSSTLQSSTISSKAATMHRSAASPLSRTAPADVNSDYRSCHNAAHSTEGRQLEAANGLASTLPQWDAV